MIWWLFLDDIRLPPTLSDKNNSYVIARSSSEAKQLVIDKGMPTHISFDHVLGDDDTSIIFLRWLTNEYYESDIPTYIVHSSNPIGKQNIVSIMESWKKSKSITEI